MEKLPNNNPWAEKLEQVSLPDTGEAWKSMAAILDKEMPPDRRKKKRRVLWLILLLFLLSGSGYFLWHVEKPARPASAIDRFSPLRQTPSSGTPSSSTASPGTPSSATPSSATPSSEASQVPIRGTSRVEYPAGPAGNWGEATPIRIRGLRRADPGCIVPLGLAGPHLIRGGPLHSDDPLKCPPVERQKKTGFVVGIGLNQAIPVYGQQVWTNPSGGLNTWWKDYIPVPFVRYYFQPRLFVQAEARIHAPQYTPKDLWFDYKNNDSMNSGLVIIKKLFYFQLPVTIHYAPSPDWSIGLGLQYSHYGKGIVATADSNLFGNQYNYIGPLSGFPMVFVEHNEFRGLVSVDYTYRHWIIGMSYDAAFTKALGVRVPDPAAAPQAAVLYAPPPVRNSSLQLFVRYILWDGRNKDR